MTKIAFENVLFPIREDAVEDFQEFIINCQSLMIYASDKSDIVAEILEKVTNRKNNELYQEDINELKKLYLRHSKV